MIKLVKFIFEHLFFKAFRQIIITLNIKLLKRVHVQI